jgi:hypothetical protein
MSSEKRWQIIGGIVCLIGFAGLTFYLCRNGFTWWAVLTGCIAFGGLGMIFEALEKKGKLKDWQKVSCPSCGQKNAPTFANCVKCGKSLERAKRAAGSAEGSSKEKGQETILSRCRYWMCSKCGGVFEKEDLETKLEVLSGPGRVSIIGSRACSNCGTTHQSNDIYAGKYDVPKQHWGRLEREMGKPVEL